MERFSEFMGAALPWIALGILLAVFFAKSAIRKKDKDRPENYGSEGMALGMCLGVALASALHFDIGMGMIVGMALGLLIGSKTDKTK